MVTGRDFMDGFPVTFSEAVCLGTSLALSGAFYYLYNKSRAIIHKLNDAPHLNIDDKLKDILRATAGGGLQYVVIEGAVRPVGEALTSPSKKVDVGVLQKFTLSEHRLVWNSFTRSWMDSEREVHQRVNSVPFVLVGSDEIAVKVLCPLQAAGPSMEVTHEKFHQVNSGFFDNVFQYLSGEKLKGQLETEKMLKVGTALTGVGELILDADDSLVLQPPTNGSQYFLSIVDFESLRREQQSTAAWWKVLAIASASVGTAVLLWVCRRYYQQLRHRWDQEQQRREFARLRDEASGLHTAGGAEEAGEETQVENPCVICYSQPRDCILLDCGHVCCCHRCFQALLSPQCPICQQRIRRVVPLYIV